jgi:hypothetical protein
MFRQVKTHKKLTTTHGIEYEPVATMTDQHGGIVHVAVDDGCYVCFLYSDALGGFTPTHFIFPELHKLLCSLPELVR